MVTDYDCWHEEHTQVDIAAVLAVMKTNTEHAQAALTRLIANFPREHVPCPIGSDRALDVALITAHDVRNPALLAKLDAVAGRVLKA
jgi:5'-methylthioadenosine phosphorylase